MGIIDWIYFLWKKGNRIETKLAAYQGYRPDSIIAWKQQTGLSWSVVMKLLRKIEILNAPKVREIIAQIVTDNEALFARPNCYITGFGNTGKSGDVILYDFSHTRGVNQRNIVKTWEIQRLPPKSIVVFVEDIIGTGTQSVAFINDRLMQLISPSYEPYLLSLCASPHGIAHVKDNTFFDVIPGIVLDGENFQFLSESNPYFTSTEKRQLKELNERLKKPGSFDFDLGLLLAFYFAIPNNVMPIIWKDNYPYVDSKGQKKQWKALLPRQY